MNHIKPCLDVIDKVRDHVALGLMSDPGLSKTAQIKQWAAENSRRYCELIISQRMPSEISGMPMPVEGSRTMEIFDFQTLLDLEDGDVLAFDEFTNGNIQTLNACLTLIQERVMLSGKKLPSLVIVAMGNPQGRCDLLPQTKQRFWWVNVSWDEKTWKNYIHNTWGLSVDRALLSAISDQYAKGFASSAEFNYYTPRTMENLLRIAQVTPDSSEFWVVSDVPRHIVRALYDTLASKTTFARVGDRIEEWINEQAYEPGSESAENFMTFMTDLMACGSMGDLKEFIEQAKLESCYDTIMPVFMEFIQTTDIDGGKKEARDADQTGPTPVIDDD